MSTRSGRSGDRSARMAGKLDHWQWRKWRKYRCVYCGRLFQSVDALPSHEVSCDMRTTTKRQWQSVIEKAKRDEAKKG